MTWREKLVADHDRFRDGLPKPLEEYVLAEYGTSLASVYGGLPIKNPFGKASGQLSLNLKQVEADCDAGLGFVVLKTLIAQDEQGAQSMRAWAIPATHMKVERIRGTRPEVLNDEGWTVTWKGRGWSESFEAYLEFFRESLRASRASDILVVPSCKFHLPQPGENIWREAEYEYTVNKLLDVWRSEREAAMPIEKDFSPTLAGDKSFSEQRENILNWLSTVPRLIRKAAAARKISIGLKIFNAMFDDDFQLEMLRFVHAASGDERPDYLIYGNRLFDPARSFEGVAGVAFGGPDLSARNISVLSRISSDDTRPTLPLSATGNIITGQIAFEYMKLGATSFQMHSLFQLPDSEFAMRKGSRTERAMHRLIFHPSHGFLNAVLKAKEIHR
jgi:hypothetical protein